MKIRVYVVPSPAMVGGCAPASSGGREVMGSASRSPKENTTLWRSLLFCLHNLRKFMKAVAHMSYESCTALLRVDVMSFYIKNEFHSIIYGSF